MIFLSGDVHNWLSSKTPSAHGGTSEPSIAVSYARLAADAEVKITLFITGRALAQQAGEIQTLASFGNVELGAHGWDSFRNHRLRTGLWCLFGSRYGPRLYQKIEIKKTLRTFETLLGRIPTVWRGHAYYADRNTYPLLKTFGIRVVSDRIGDHSISEELPGLWSVPINTPPDHDSLVHGQIAAPAIDSTCASLRAQLALRTHPSMSMKLRSAIHVRRVLRRLVDIQVMNSGEMWYASQDRMELLEPRQWERRLYQQLEERLATSGFATLLLHPVCMNALDGLATFQRIIDFCRRFRSAFISEAVPRQDGSAMRMAVPSATR